MTPNEAETSQATDSTRPIDPSARRLRVRRVKLSELVEDVGNPRRHDERDLAATEASLKAHGQVDPLVVQKGSLRLIAGNGRKEAMRRLAWTHADVVEVECDDVEFRALSIRLNRTGELAGWDGAGLEADLAMLAEAGWGNLQDFGWDEASLDTMMKAQTTPTADDWGKGMSGLPDGDRQPFQQMTFTMHDDQAATVRRALDAAKKMGAFDGPNENSNGNAIARVCEVFLASVEIGG